MVLDLAAAALELLYNICCGSGGVASSYVVKVCKANGGQSGAVADGSSKRAPHRCVHKVAHARHEYARKQRLRHQQEQAAVNGELLNSATHFKRAYVIETIEIVLGQPSKLNNGEIPKHHPPSHLQEIHRIKICMWQVKRDVTETRI